MTATAAPHPLSTDALHAVFVALLPRIIRHGRVYFRHLKCPHRMEDALAEMAALAWRWCVALAHRGKDVTRFPSALAAFAARAVKSGRRLCRMESGQDALSPRARARRGFLVERLPDFSTPSGNPLADALADNTVTPVAEQVAFRLDFPAWLATLGGRDRRVALDLMVGERTRDVARKYGRSPGRVAQLRRRFHDDWRRFHAEDP